VLKVSDIDLLREMRTVYRRRLNEATQGLNEVEIQDKKGNIILSPGLKIRHKKSKFEYTIKSIDRAAKTVCLLPPEAPRVMSPEAQRPQSMSMPTDAELLDLAKGKIEIPADFFTDDPPQRAPAGDKNVPSGDIMDVSFADFTKNYEVTE